MKAWLVAHDAPNYVCIVAVLMCWGELALGYHLGKNRRPDPVKPKPCLAPDAARGPEPQAPKKFGALTE